MGSPLNFYEILNIPKNSSSEEIRNAYKALAKKWHPDKHPPSFKQEAEAKFKAIAQAYEALIDLYKSGIEGRKMEELAPEYAATARKSFKGVVYSKGVPTSFKGCNYARSQGIDSKDFVCSKGGAAAAANTPAPQSKSFSGQLLLKKKSPSEERKLECTLEELFHGCKKEVAFTRNVVDKNGMIVRKQESETIRVKPGWKKGTKITFQGMDHNIVFLIAEKKHPVYKRVGNDLLLKVEIPLVNALTGWTFSFRLLCGEKTTCSIHDEIICPGYEKIIQGQGMPIRNEKGKRGDLRIKFKIVFPTRLSPRQKSSIVEILKGTA